MKLIFSFVFALILGSRAFGAEGKYEEFFASVTSHFYMFQMSAREGMSETFIQNGNAGVESNTNAAVLRLIPTSLVAFRDDGFYQKRRKNFS